MAFVTCVTWPELSDSDRLAASALETRGVSVSAVPWNDPGRGLDGFGAAVFRSCWDYHHDARAYLLWLERWELAGTRFWNPPELIRWNLSKRYLLDLERRGVDIVPTVLLEQRAARRLRALLAERGWARAVVKPAVGASAHDTTLVTPASATEVARAIDAGHIRRPVIVQPFVEAIQTRGEWSVVFVDGVRTHAVLKRPAAGDFRVQAYHGGTWARAEPPPEVARAAELALAALPVPPLYARVDGVEAAASGEPRFLVMEMEVHEPALFFTVAPEAAEALAEAIVRRLAG